MYDDDYYDEEYGPGRPADEYGHAQNGPDDPRPPRPPMPRRSRYYTDGRRKYLPKKRQYYMQLRPYHYTPDRPLGDEILAAQRSTKGGIYYTKANQYKEIHFVDQHIVYECQHAPLYRIPYDEREALTTRLAVGLVRREALDLLGYSYVTMKNGILSISEDLEFVSQDFHDLILIE